jgi:hypothetical protein
MTPPPRISSHEVLIDVMPDLKPQLTEDFTGAFIMEIPVVDVGLSTACTPPSPHHFTYKPHEVMPVVMPELVRVVFDPRTNTPRNGQMTCCTTKSGTIMKFDPSRNVEAKIRTNSPYGKAILGSMVLNWRLHVEGHTSISHDMGKSYLDVELRFSFECNVSTNFEAVYAELPAPPVPGPSSKRRFSCLELCVSGPQNTPHDFLWTAMQGGAVEKSLEAFVEVMPNIQPEFNRASNDTFVMVVPDFTLQFSTSCVPAPPPIAGLPAFRPFEEVPVSMPEIHHVVFDPQMNTPCDGQLSCITKTSGTIMQFLPTYSIDAKLKHNSPHGHISLTDVQTGKEIVFNWRLQVESNLAVVKDAGVAGSSQLVGELQLTFECNVCA